MPHGATHRGDPHVIIEAGRSPGSAGSTYFGHVVGVGLPGIAAGLEVEGPERGSECERVPKVALAGRVCVDSGRLVVMVGAVAIVRIHHGPNGSA